IRGHLRPPDVEGVLGIVITGLPMKSRRNVVHVAGVLAVAAPGISGVVEVVRSEHVAPGPPSLSESMPRHLHRAKSDLVYGAYIPAAVMQTGRVGARERDQMMIAAMNAVHECDVIAGAV